ncbi:MAG: SUMF1/EgtB/PvdO family nonheme iron enzyme [Thermoguttaceae bacterium]|nr:SUMF1/EgtB/PvdO family nonheme iron enzyme [Thermoguttaceae bacterium]
MAELTPGLILCNDYELVEPIGKGGMGAIWRAKDLPGNRDVALKFVPRDVQNFESEMDRVEDVFGVIHALQHQNICPLYAMKNSGNEFGFFLVMKFIPGLPLGKFARKIRHQTGDFTVAQLVSVLRPIAAALDYAHTRRPPVIHRDIKPANILVITDDDLRVLDVQLIDFGLAATFRASLTRVSQVKLNTSGTRPYMAPEQWDGVYQNAATDQYALGITAYELLSGRFPFESDDFAILEKCVKTAPVPPIETLSAKQNAVLRRALAKTRDERFPTCAAFIEALASAPTEDFNSMDEEPTFCDSIPPTPAKSLLEQLAEEERQAEEAKRREAEEKLRQQISALEERIGEEYQSAHYAEAVAHLNELLQLKPEHPNAQWLLKKATEKLESQRKEEEKRLERGRKAREEAERKELERKGGPRKILTVDGIDYAFRWCPPGEFMMGSPEGEENRDDDETLHHVKLTYGFWMLETQVTQAMWRNVMGKNPSSFKGEQKPVEQVSWDDCQEFCRKLSLELGQRVQIPTEAQWEYACRAGTTTEFNFGNILNGEDANCDGNYPYGTNIKGPCLKQTVPVGSYAPNAWGLYDMHGNVWEWCSDYYDENYYTISPTDDPENTAVSLCRVFRGGSWRSDAVSCRSGYRGGDTTDHRRNYLGLRVILVPSSEQ